MSRESILVIWGDDIGYWNICPNEFIEKGARRAGESKIAEKLKAGYEPNGHAVA